MKSGCVGHTWTYTYTDSQTYKDRKMYRQTDRQINKQNQTDRYKEL